MANNYAAALGEKWESLCQMFIEEKSALLDIADTRFEGQFDGADTVHFPYTNSITIADVSSSYDAVAATDITVTDDTFTLNVRKGGAMKMSEEDAKFMASDPEPALISKLSNDYALGMYNNFLAQYANAGLTVDKTDVEGTGSAGDGVAVTESNVFDLFQYATEKLEGAGVMDVDKFAVVSPKIARLIRAAVGNRATTLGDDSLRRGGITNIDGFDIYVSNQLTTAASKTHLVAGVKGAIKFAAPIKPTIRQVDNSSTLDFVNGLKTITKYGSKIFNNDQNKVVDIITVA